MIVNGVEEMAATSERARPCSVQFRNENHMSKLQELIVDYRKMCSEQRFNPQNF